MDCNFEQPNYLPVNIREMVELFSLENLVSLPLDTLLEQITILRCGNDEELQPKIFEALSLCTISQLVTIIPTIPPPIQNELLQFLSIFSRFNLGAAQQMFDQQILICIQQLILQPETTEASLVLMTQLVQALPDLFHIIYDSIPIQLLLDFLIQQTPTSGYILQLIYFYIHNTLPDGCVLFIGQTLLQDPMLRFLFDDQFAFEQFCLVIHFVLTNDMIPVEIIQNVWPTICALIYHYFSVLIKSASPQIALNESLCLFLGAIMIKCTQVPIQIDDILCLAQHWIHEPKQFELLIWVASLQVKAGSDLASIFNKDTFLSLRNSYSRFTIDMKTEFQLLVCEIIQHGEPEYQDEIDSLELISFVIECIINTQCSSPEIPISLLSQMLTLNDSFASFLGTSDNYEELLQALIDYLDDTDDSVVNSAETLHEQLVALTND